MLRIVSSSKGTSVTLIPSQIITRVPRICASLLSVSASGRRGQSLSNVDTQSQSQNMRYEQRRNENLKKFS